MNLVDKIKARSSQPEATQGEVEALNAELDSQIKAEAQSELEVELTPEQLESRTKDSYEDEIKKLREENAKRRKKEQEAKEKALAMADEVFKVERDEYDNKLAEMKKQLEEYKALKKEEIKVEAEVKKAESNAEAEAYRKELEELRREREAFKAEVQARKEAEESEKALRKQAAENRFNSMLTEIPEEYKEAASKMFKGYDDSSEGLIAITKFKAQGLFGKKTIEVVSRIPRESDIKNETKPLNSREKHAKRVDALASRRQGIKAGDTIIGNKSR